MKLTNQLNGMEWKVLRVVCIQFDYNADASENNTAQY